MTVRKRKGTRSGRSTKDAETSKAEGDSQTMPTVTDITCECCLLPIKLDSELNEELARIDTCHHQFHFACIKKWSTLETTCPQCKAVFSRIEKICQKTGTVLETVECKSLFLWDHSDEDGDIEHENQPQESAKVTNAAIAGIGANLLAPDELESTRVAKKPRKSVELPVAVALTERYVKRMAMNDICYTPPKVTYEATPMPKHALRRDSEFKLEPVYQEDFIGK
ncbi:uncharacterized protein BXIN_2466 [Babesia sp. Xinjiang]|uniref:uncharacterized protein n=1 Tax=Babesia sp. Xinjiang TaxID=462227 RepID=UPI000A214C7F|nr:uncharacterized protein BXIN_2466 [Babesia sp. Xinjiang]ORM41496.1 hypothetical protein BXIN_2466 [Babesia sp. Xinjiang]